MQVFGIGTDIVECERIARMLQKHGATFLHRVYTEREIAYCQKRKRAVEHFAGRWAAKEAIFKALGTGWAKGMAWTDIEILPDAQGQPLVQVRAAVHDYMQRVGIEKIFVSISHCRRYATACALALRATIADNGSAVGPAQLSRFGDHDSENFADAQDSSDQKL
ncbi:MAG: holo-ACP synthase [Gemmatales bacterium]|nr:holo-ACP synthase [Gemmatales bacterium]MDW8176117.1 holo-ACP synthase [Gemmatales bacterium]